MDHSCYVLPLSEGDCSVLLNVKDWLMGGVCRILVPSNGKLRDWVLFFSGRLSEEIEKLSYEENVLLYAHVKG